MSAVSPSRTILIVDDDPAYRELLTELMKQFRKNVWDVLAAPDAGKALTVLREVFAHLVVVDARMPVVDGLQLIRLIRQHYPHLRIAVLTGFADEPTRATYLDNGADLFIEKPRSSEGIQTLFITLDDLMRGTPEHGFRGVLEQVELQDLLQIECSKRNSSRLEVFAGNQRGEIFVREGAVVHAQVGDLTGEAAFFHLLSLKGGELRVRPYTEPPRTTITSSWMSLLMEWAQRRDEDTSALARSAAPILASVASDLAEGIADDAAILHLLAQPLTEAERQPPPVRIEEMFVCSASGDVLYEANCASFVARKRLLDYLSAKAARLGAAWPLGKLEVVEFDTRQGRCVAQVMADVGVFVRTSGADSAAGFADSEGVADA